MKKERNIFLLLLLCVFLSCNQGDNASDYNLAEAEMAAADADVVGESQSPQAIEVTERKLIKEGYVEFRTDHLQTTRQNILQAVNKYQAYVSSDQAYKFPEKKSQTITVRIPSDKFDSFLAEATQGVVHFDNKQINVRDVTEQFVDVQARLKTKKELETRYLELLKQTKTMTEILEIERQIAQLRSEIESIEGRLRLLENQVSYSTLSITFYENIARHTEFGDKFKNGFKNGWNNLIWFFVFLINLWPFILLGILIFIGIRFVRRRKK
ncbi:DUF4349 domain-containing protein [Mesonia sp. K7]|uniref:DUF4349 domain-containing protein n=1 Tax=Mesonia sp. K7 TaxID=2218606 RepID=UPI001314E8D6|nr:DUF4349 domain-containing protein [Mesonia sp. K7]